MFSVAGVQFDEMCVELNGFSPHRDYSRSDKTHQVNQSKVLSYRSSHQAQLTEKVWLWTVGGDLEKPDAPTEKVWTQIHGILTMRKVC